MPLKFVPHDLLESHKRRLANNAGSTHIRFITANYQTQATPLPSIIRSKPSRLPSPQGPVPETPLSLYEQPEPSKLPKISSRAADGRRHKQFLKLENYVFGPKRVIVLRDESLQRSQTRLDRSVLALDASMPDLLKSIEFKQTPAAKAKAEHYAQRLEIQTLSLNLRRRGLMIEDATLERALLRPKEQGAQRKLPRYMKAVLQEIEKTPLSDPAQSEKKTLKPMIDFIAKAEVKLPAISVKTRKKGTFMGLLANPVDQEDMEEDLSVAVKVNSWWSQGTVRRMRTQSEIRKRQNAERKQIKASEPPIVYQKSFGHLEQSVMFERKRAASEMKQAATLNAWSYTQPESMPDQRTRSKTTSVSFYEAMVLPRVAAPMLTFRPNIQIEHQTTSLSSKHRLYNL